MQIDVLVGPEDWRCRVGEDYKEGAYRYLNNLKDAGVKRIYMRTHAGGQALYPSKVANPKPGHESWDVFPVALEVGHELGMEVHGWYTHFEESHGGSLSKDLRKALVSGFSEAHPEYTQMDRDGVRYHGTLDFFFDEVYQYKIKIAEELASFGLDGILLDYARHHAVPSGDAKTGIHRLGYNPEIVAAFKEKTGKDAFAIDPADEEWLKFKAEPHTRFVREFRKMLLAVNPDAKIGLMLWPEDYFTWAAIDVPAMTKEGLVDMLTAMSLKYTFHPREAKAQIECLKAQNKGENVRILPGVCGYNFIDPDAFEDYIEEIENNGVHEAMNYEDVAFHLHFTIGNIHRNVPNYKRKLKATKVSGDIDWNSVPVYDDFLALRKDDDLHNPRNKTTMQIAYDADNLYVKFFCYDQDAENIFPVQRNKDNYYMQKLGPRHYWGDWDSFNVILDAHLSHTDFYHFKVEPDGFMIQQTRTDDEWQGKWDADVEVTKEGWGGLITIPFATLDVKDPMKMGANMIRTERTFQETDVTHGKIDATYSQEVSSWFRVWLYTVLPIHLGHMIFE